MHTYGVASAQHYWGRKAALFLRLLYKLLGPDLQYGYVFVDDYSLLVKDVTPTHTMMMVLLFLETYGVPIAYDKIYIGHSETWVGSLVHLKTNQIDLTPEKKQSLQDLADQITPGNTIIIKTVMTYIHRMSWAVQALEQLRAFLAPL